MIELPDGDVAVDPSPVQVQIELPWVSGFAYRNVFVQLIEPSLADWAVGAEVKGVITNLSMAHLTTAELKSTRPADLLSDVSPELIDLVDRLDYAPGRLVSIDRDSENRAVLHVTFEDVDDTYRKGRVLHVHHLVPIPVVVRDMEWWLRWLMNALIATEAHEAREWFKIDGKRLFDPHHPDGAQYRLVRVPG